MNENVLNEFIFRVEPENEVFTLCLPWGFEIEWLIQIEVLQIKAVYSLEMPKELYLPSGWIAVSRWTRSWWQPAAVSHFYPSIRFLYSLPPALGFTSCNATLLEESTHPAHSSHCSLQSHRLICSAKPLNQGWLWSCFFISFLHWRRIETLSHSYEWLLLRTSDA